MRLLKQLPALVASAVLGLAGLANPATADDATTCNTASGGAKILACTSVISAGGPDVSWAYANRGNAYREMGDKDRAFADYNEAIRINPRNPSGVNGRGAIFREREATTIALLPITMRRSGSIPNMLLGTTVAAISIEKKATTIGLSLITMKRCGSIPTMR